MKGKMSGKMRLLLLLTLLMVVSVVAAACGGDDDEDTPTAGTTPVVGETPTTPPVGTTPVAGDTPVAGVTPSPVAMSGEPVSGGRVEYAMSFQSCWDPTTSCSLQTFYNIHAPLIELDAATGAFVPALLESWDVSADGKVYTLTLKEGLTFHDGTPINAAAIHNQAFLMTDPDAIKDRAVARVRFKDAWDGYNPTLTEYPDGETGMTIVMHFSKVFAGRLTNMAGPGAHMASPAGLELYGHPGFGLHPVGAGAFQFSSIDLGVSITLDRFDNFYDSPAPYLDGIKDWNVPDATVRDAGLRAGQFQAIYRPLIREISLLEREGFNVDGGISLGYTNMNFCHCQPPFDSKLARQAFSSAVDRALILETLEGGQGALGNTTYVSPSSPFYKPADQMNIYDFNLDRARQLLVDNGTPDGFEFTAITPTITAHILRAQATAGMLAEVGIKMNLQVVDLGVYFGKTRTLDYQAGWLWIGSYPDIETNSQAYYSLDPSHVNPYVSAEWDAAWEKQRLALDFEARKAAWWEVQDIFAEDLPGFAIYYEKILNAWHPDLMDLRISGFRDEVWLPWAWWKDGRNP